MQMEIIARHMSVQEDFSIIYKQKIFEKQTIFEILALNHCE